MTQEEIFKEQSKICKKYSVELFEAPLDLKIGISKNIKSGVMPINGLRHKPENETAGWYIWAGGEIDTDTSLWDSLHIEHLIKIYPQILKYLGLPPGYRFLIDDNGYEDVWFDEKLLNPES